MAHRPTPFPGIGRSSPRLILFGLYLVVLAFITLIPITHGRDVPESNWTPFATILSYVISPDSWRDSLAQIVGNVLLFLPMGLLLSPSSDSSRSRHPLLRVLLLTVAISGGIELAQAFWIPGRAGDIDDILLNAIGAITGALIGLRRPGLVG